MGEQEIDPRPDGTAPSHKRGMCSRILYCTCRLQSLEVEVVAKRVVSCREKKRVTPKAEMRDIYSTVLYECCNVKLNTLKLPEMPNTLPVSMSLPTVATPRIAPPSAASTGWKLRTTSDMMLCTVRAGRESLRQVCVRGEPELSYLFSLFDRSAHARTTVSFLSYSYP